MDDTGFLNIIKGVSGYDDTFEVGRGFIDTGCYALNALTSGSIFGGIPDGRVIGLAGDPATGKSYLSYGLIREFLNKHPTGRVVLFDSEIAIDKEDLKARDIDVSRVNFLYPDSLQEFRTQATQILNGYTEMKKNQRIPLLFVLDSLSNMPSNKESQDAEDGKDVADMTRAKTIRSVFRIITPKLGKNKIPMIVTNHTYDNIMSMYGGKEIGGGGGLKYAASTIITLSKAKDGDANEVKGLIITAKTYKSRFTKPEKKVKLNLDFTKGLGKYYGLLDIAETHGIFVKSGNKFETVHGKFFGSVINKDPERFFTDDILLKIDAACKKEFMFGAGDEPELEDSIPDEEEFDPETGELLEEEAE